MTAGTRVKNAGRWTAMLIGAALVSALFLAPVVLIFTTAFKPDREILRFTRLLPEQWTLGNFKEIITSPEEIPIVRWLLNSVMVSSCVTALVLAVDSLAAFALARLRPRGRGVMLGLIVATMMVPGQILLVPAYLILNWLGWIDTPLALIIPAGAGAYGVFMLHQFFLSLPRDLEDAARIDGCSAWGIFWHVALPLSRSALTTLGIFTFIGSWNDFLGPLVFIDSLTKYTLPVGIALFQTQYFSEYGLTLAACVICTVPVIALFLIFQRQIIRGITFTGMKE